MTLLQIPRTLSPSLFFPAGKSFQVFVEPIPHSLSHPIEDRAVADTKSGSRSSVPLLTAEDCKPDAGCEHGTHHDVLKASDCRREPRADGRLEDLLGQLCQPGQRGAAARVVPCLVRLAEEASHSWSGPSGHFHQNFLSEPATTSSGVKSPFFARSPPGAFDLHSVEPKGRKKAAHRPGGQRSHI